MNLINHLDKDNLHHAYLIEGIQEEIIPELLKFIESIGVKISGNPDFFHISYDSFKIDDARSLKSVEYEKSFSNGKKIFLITINNFLLEAQNTLLKIFEEPIENTHFFIIVPNSDVLLKTLVSRFYLIKTKTDVKNELEDAEKFIKMSLKDRIDFIKELIKEDEGEDEEETLEIKSTRAKALKFLNALESILVSKGILDTQSCFAHIFKVREFINQPGASLKTLMESIAISVPNF